MEVVTIQEQNHLIFYQPGCQATTLKTFCDRCEQKDFDEQVGYELELTQAGKTTFTIYPKDAPIKCSINVSIDTPLESIDLNQPLIFSNVQDNNKIFKATQKVVDLTPVIGTQAPSPTTLASTPAYNARKAIGAAFLIVLLATFAFAAYKKAPTFFRQ